MTFQMTREDFLIKSGYTKKDWEQSTLDWDQFVGIANQHEKMRSTLVLYGGTIANRIQAFGGVHSVRWRIKDTFAVLKKILRKNLEVKPKDKWQTITPENYRSVFSDLIGVRALHLLKEECIEVDKQIRDTWNVDDTTIFKRHGDLEISEIIERGATEEIHSAGYRSIHYGISYQPEKEPILVEIQVRTIFQEGWSEIDHRVKYPDFSNNEILKYFLNVFNGLSGTADEMGSFVILLDNLIKQQSASLIESELAISVRDAEVEKLQFEINKLRSDGRAPNDSIDSLQTSVNKIKDRNTSFKNSTWINSILTPNIHNLNLAAEQARSIMSGLSIDPGFTEAMRNQNAAYANAIKQSNFPNPAILEAIQNLTRPNAAMQDAIKGISLPMTSISAVISQEVRDSSQRDALEMNKKSTSLPSSTSIDNENPPVLQMNEDNNSLKSNENTEELDNEK
ncbi:RelA/SpoT domain-containing protein [Pseudomonas sp. LY-1]|uniref:RelA/SpoT domain-containing protein n=1 Tax=Pseudomonas veronii TaxID=76761 RepID=A0ABS0VIG9_PSEVE|nr:RelA/SpoT domain-containing protein [Pseudomonas veronii]MBI6553059.1 RelA/SpoT domain-containing protein [Pseudomonas veronii]MBI6650143.1 RelA/SpoT domain-containing protein [Pseudomonas veronii]